MGAAELRPEDVQVASLGEGRVTSPLHLSCTWGDGVVNFVPDGARIRHTVQVLPRDGRLAGRDGEPVGQGADEIFFEMAGPRERIFFDPARAKAGIVTCGGLCPGLNNVIRSIVLELHHRYGVTEILGFRYGYQGLDPSVALPPVVLNPDVVDQIHTDGGTILGSSRGPREPAVMVDYLQTLGVNMLFCIGGDGTQRGAHSVAEEVARRGAPIAVIGVPKTIDNDIRYVWRTFGYTTAVEKAREVLACAHVEARGARNGVALVKLMGRHAGFIAAGATVASQDVNITLVPEVPFSLEGETGLLAYLQQRLARRGHAVIAVAEGAGVHLMSEDQARRDASGNLRFDDIGPFLRQKLLAWFAERDIPVSLKYFDPSYSIRSVPANCDDALLCDQFGRHAVHAAMAGKTDMLVGLWYNCFTNVPIPLAVAQPKCLDPESELWRAVLATTGQPVRFGG